MSVEVEDIVEKYRSSKMNVRLLIATIVGLLPALYYWTEEGERIQYDLDSAIQQKDTAETKFENGKRKVAQLPALLAKLSEIETQLRAAKKILPDSIHINNVLAAIGNLESEYNVKVTKFVPGTEIQPNPQIEYKELSIALEISGRFPQVMQFFDSLVHLPNLTHLRDITLEAGEEEEDNEASQGGLVAKANLILFKGL